MPQHTIYRPGHNRKNLDRKNRVKSKRFVPNSFTTLTTSESPARVIRRGNKGRVSLTQKVALYALLCYVPNAFSSPQKARLCAKSRPRKPKWLDFTDTKVVYTKKYNCGDAAFVFKSCAFYFQPRSSSASLSNGDLRTRHNLISSIVRELPVQVGNVIIHVQRGKHSVNPKHSSSSES